MARELGKTPRPNYTKIRTQAGVESDTKTEPPPHNIWVCPTAWNSAPGIT